MFVLFPYCCFVYLCVYVCVCILCVWIVFPFQSISDNRTIFSFLLVDGVVVLCLKTKHAHSMHFLRLTAHHMDAYTSVQRSRDRERDKCFI